MAVRRLPLLVGGSVLIATLFLWQALITQERAYIEQQTQLEAMSVKNELTARLDTQIRTLVRMSKRWDHQGKTLKDDWEFEAQLNVQDFKGFQAIQWVDPEFHVRWIVPRQGNSASLNLNLAFEPQRRTALEAARDRGDVTVTHSIDLVQGGKGFHVYVPIVQNETFSGFIIGVFRTQTLLDTILGENNVAPGYAIAVFDGLEEIYRRDNNGSRQYEQEWSQQTLIDFYGTTWQVRVWPSAELLAELQSPLPNVVLIGGILMASLLALAFHLAQTARLRAKQAELANNELKQFTADASHELRSPLTAINTAIEVMQSHPERIHPLDAKKLVAIARATDQLIRLTEDLLFLARSDAAVANLGQEWKSVLLDQVLQDVVKLLEPQAQAKGITITSDLLAGISVNGEATQLNRLFSNLLENAVKYTLPPGSVLLKMSLSQQFVVVRVEDTGMGIAPENLPFIFQRFWRADKARARRIEGSGLGLAIAQAIVQRHGGKITVSSQVGVGSCFQVYLPMV